MTKKETGFEFLTALIPKGKSNAVTGASLDKALDCDTRTRYAVIESARKSGLIICADNSGYYLPETVEEMREYYETAHQKAVTMLSTLKTVRRKLVSMGIKVDGKK